MNFSLKSFITILLALLSFNSFAQKDWDIAGVWTGTLFNDSTQKYIPFEVAISRFSGDLSGYSYTVFMVDSIANIGVKEVTVKERNQTFTIRDKKLIDDNYTEAPDKGVYTTLVLEHTQNDTADVLSGKWFTNKTRFFYPVGGAVFLTKRRQVYSTNIIPRLEKLGLANKLSFLQPKPANDIAGTNKNRKKSKESPEPTMAIMEPEVVIKVPKKDTSRLIKHIDADQLTLLIDSAASRVPETMKKATGSTPPAQTAEKAATAGVVNSKTEVTQNNESAKADKPNAAAAPGEGIAKSGKKEIRTGESQSGEVNSKNALIIQEANQKKNSNSVAGITKASANTPTVALNTQGETPGRQDNTLAATSGSQADARKNNVSEAVPPTTGSARVTAKSGTRQSSDSTFVSSIAGQQYDNKSVKDARNSIEDARIENKGATARINQEEHYNSKKLISGNPASNSTSRNLVLRKSSTVETVSAAKEQANSTSPENTQTAQASHNTAKKQVKASETTTNKTTSRTVKNSETISDSARRITGSSAEEEKNATNGRTSTTTAVASGGKITLPAPDLSKRKIETIQTVQLASDSIVLSLYDNGIVDGDTVSILLNGSVLLSRIGLKEEAFNHTLHITPEMGDSLNLVMYAENLGSIPPNSGLLIVRDKSKTYEIRFSGDLQKNSAIILLRNKQNEFSHK
ncbi:MAG TPA: hypothetical protein PLM81_05680 [Ginsengibacter sp.]|nr:hypothetical protein [Ginsengibacter sp.]